MENKETEPKQKELQKGNRLFGLIQSLIALISPLVGIQKKASYPFSSIDHTGDVLFPHLQ